MHHPITLQAINLSRCLSAGSDTLTILKDISFEINQGEWVALTGPSGSGKSTLLGLLAGIDTPTAGQLLLDGTDIAQMRETQLARIRNQKIGIVFQAFNLIPTLTAQQNVEIPLYVRPSAPHIRQQAREMLEQVGLENRLNHRPHQLSGGQQQRVAIARALITHPSILLADEPTGNLDTQTGEQILRLFANLREQFGLTIIVVTHDQQVAKAADRILHLVDGQLVNPTTVMPSKEVAQ